MSILFSIIIPQQNSINTLQKLFDSIPQNDDLEILLIDNSPIPLKKQEFGLNREYRLLWCSPTRFAGGARNVGIENAIGKWLIFADADDYFTENAFTSFYAKSQSIADIVYFNAQGVDLETNRPTNRAKTLSDQINLYIANKIDEKEMGMSLQVPWAKMIKRDFVQKKNILFDEIIAGNDSFFSLLSVYYASKIEIENQIVYAVTTQKGSLKMRNDYEVIHSRYLVTLKRNQFFRNHHLSHLQDWIMPYFLKAIRNYPFRLFKMLYEAVSFKQNVFLGWYGHLSSYIKNHIF